MLIGSSTHSSIMFQECDLHQHHPKSLRREHIRTPIIPPDAPPAAAPRAGLLSKAFASEGTAWDAEGDEESAEDGPADSGLTSDNQGGFNSGVKLESGTSHHGLKSKRKHKKKRGKSRGHSKDRVEGGGNEAERHDDRSAERSSTERPIGQSSKDESAEKDGESGGSSSIEHPTKHPVSCQALKARRVVICGVYLLLFWELFWRCVLYLFRRLCLAGAALHATSQPETLS